MRALIQSIANSYLAGYGGKVAAMSWVFNEAANYGGALITQIDEDTRKMSREIISNGIRDGLDVNSLQEKLDSIYGQERALRIAVTENVLTYNRGAMVRNQEMGVTHTDVLDGVEDEICDTANGATWTIEDAIAHPLGHPFCTRDFLPRDPNDPVGEVSRPHPDEIERWQQLAG